MEEVEEIDTSCARRAQPCVRGTKAVALNIMIMVDKQTRNGGQAVCNNTNKVKCKEKRSKSPCKKSKKKECCNSGYDNFMPPPSTPNAQMLPCGCVVVYDDPRPKTNAEIQCSQRQPDKCCKGNQFNACISSASQTTIKQEGCSKCDKEKRGCTNNSCQTSNQVATPQCSKAKQCGRCRTTGCQATAPDKCSSSKKRCGSTKCSSCQTSAQSHIHAPRLCGACCSKNHCQHCAQRQQPKLCGACASSSSVGSNRHCHKTSSECQTHATCIPKTKEQMNHARVGDDVKKEVSRTQMKREQSGQKIVQKEESRPKIVQREESRPKVVQREESRPKVVQREESRPKVKESKIPTCIPVEVSAKTDRSVQSFYSSMVVNKPPPVPADPIPTPVESAFPMGRSLEPQRQEYPEPQKQEEPEPQKQEEPEPLEDMIELQPPTSIDEPVEEEGTYVA
ncbi:Zinc metalloprotease ZmpB [Orchesella cincta]|uniref:Zinc metalloprotease ZmpB n=1 Tax=Orchesella cincta TaxID=48709 RepID=A0A1D2MMY4_ORCCI|nr:Zinc metalloprotease ZmpB [Orchesella cincta]